MTKLLPAHPRQRQLRHDRRAVGAGLVVAGLAVAALAVRHPVGSGHGPPRPAATAYGAVVTAATVDDVRVRPASVPAPAQRSLGRSLGRSAPTRVRIPAIGVDARVVALGLAAGGTLAVPHGRDYDAAAWYSGSPTPGETGPSVLEGHVDSAAGPSVFFRLGELRPGDRAEVARRDGSVVEFRVTAVRRYPKDRFPTSLVYGDTRDAQLRLITCGGDFDAASGHYRDNVVVFATAVR